MSKLPPRLLTEPEVAAMLSMTPAALRKARSRGTGHPRFIKLGSRIRYAPGDVVDYMRRARETETQNR